jgi:carbon-monoxide dehydrogenase small subunit
LPENPSKIVIALRVNGEDQELLAPPHLSLLEVLRENLELTGTKEGCGEGVCGSCTVLIDGRPVRSCLTLAAEAQGREITTIEGLSEGEALDPVQAAFIDHGAVQCGFCTPGMVLTAKAGLADTPRPDDKQARDMIAANVCRCTGYAKIVEAIVAVGQGEEGENV